MLRSIKVLICGDEAAKRALLTPRQASTALLAVSLLAAAAMLLQAACFDQLDNSMATLVIIAIWFVPYSVLSPLTGASQAGCRK